MAVSTSVPSGRKPYDPRSGSMEREVYPSLMTLVRLEETLASQLPDRDAHRILKQATLWLCAMFQGVRNRTPARAMDLEKDKERAKEIAHLTLEEKPPVTLPVVTRPMAYRAGVRHYGLRVGRMDYGACYGEDVSERADKIETRLTDQGYSSGINRLFAYWTEIHELHAKWGSLTMDTRTYTVETGYDESAREAGADAMLRAQSPSAAPAKRGSGSRTDDAGWGDIDRRDR